MHDAGLRPMLSLIAVLCAPIFCAGRHNLASIGPLNKLPLRFEANEGQTTSEVKFVSHGPGYTLFLSGDQVVLSLTQPAVKTSRKPDLLLGMASPRLAPTLLRMKWLGANPATRMAGLNELPGRSNYFIGNDPKRWRTGVRNYARVFYRDLYPGVDITYYGNYRQLEYDIAVAPGADPRIIRLAITGAQKMHVDSQGDLVLETAGGEIRQHKPTLYQAAVGAKKYVDGRYTITSKEEVAFQIGEYDQNKTLVLDPVLSYSTYLGGSLDDVANSIAVDRQGNAYITGYTMSPDYPTTGGQTFAGGSPESFFIPGGDAFVTKIDADGERVAYSTYLGGTGADNGLAVAVDDWGNAYVTGGTISFNFPVTSGAYQTVFGGGSGDAFVTKLNSQGDGLLYSTYLGGNDLDIGTSIAVDRTGHAFLTGFTQSVNFPTQDPLQPNNASPFFPATADAFVTKLGVDGNQLLYSTYLGGADVDIANGIALDQWGNAYVTGETASADFPTHNAFQKSNAGFGYDAFVAKIAEDGHRLVFSTYLGGSGGNDFGNSIAVDRRGYSVVAGFTDSADFPLKNALQKTNPSGFKAFVTKFYPFGRQLRYSTYLGGSGGDFAFGISVDDTGNTFVTGFTRSTDFPTKHAIQNTLAGSQAAFATKIDVDGDRLRYSTYLGGSGAASGIGIAVDDLGNAFVAGWAGPNFPTTKDAVQKANAGGVDTFVAKISRE